MLTETEVTEGQCRVRKLFISSLGKLKAEVWLTDLRAVGCLFELTYTALALALDGSMHTIIYNKFLALTI